jgi:hypothetical protein
MHRIFRICEFSIIEVPSIIIDLQQSKVVMVATAMKRKIGIKNNLTFAVYLSTHIFNKDSNLPLQVSIPVPQKHSKCLLQVVVCQAWETVVNDFNLNTGLLLPVQTSNSTK